MVMYSPIQDYAARPLQSKMLMGASWPDANRTHDADHEAKSSHRWQDSTNFAEKIIFRKRL